MLTFASSNDLHWPPLVSPMDGCEGFLKYTCRPLKLRKCTRPTFEPVFIVELLSSWLLESEQGVCHTVALPFTLKSIYLKAKEELGKFKIFQHAKNIIF
jgi:hypothetical protein